MCGIGAIIHGNVNDIERIMIPVARRGQPEGFNENKVIGDVALSCNRLMIVDRKNAKQPLRNESKTVYAVLNGEIYNYKKLKAILVKKGHKFKSDSDTEVLVHGYEQWGDKLPIKLDGQFAFVVYDLKNDSYLAARDHYGIRPMYTAKKGSTVYFASEAKQLVSFADHIDIVKPATAVTHLGAKNYYILPDKEVKDKPDKIIQRIRDLFDEAVRKRVQTDLPIAVFFSGGIDSAAVLATAMKYHDNITAIVIGKNWRSEDSDFHAALRYCQENEIPMICVSPPKEEELFKLVPKVIKATESYDPNMIKQATLSYQIAKLAKKYGFKIALCGEGADEVFIGYPEFADQGMEGVKKMSKAFFSDLHRTQLQRVDRTAMYHTLEVRVPFLDVNFVEYGMNIPPEHKLRGKVTKWILREAFKDRLPEYITKRKKVVLSEGMGHKGNSLSRGLFTEIARQQMPKSDVAKYQQRLPSIHIDTREEAYYLRHYLAYQYSKIALQKKPHVNRKHSIGSKSQNENSDVAPIIQSRKYSRHKAQKRKKLDKTVDKHVQKSQPIPIVGYWGVMGKPDADTRDIEAMEIMHEMHNRVAQVYKPGVKYTMIISDSHALMNGFEPEDFNKYIVSIKKMFAKYPEVEWVMLSDLKNQQQDLIPEVGEYDPDGVLHEKMMASASKVFNGDTHEGAKVYYQTRVQESKMLEKVYSDSIFATYNSPEYTKLFPDLPTLHLRSSSKGSRPPWLTKNGQNS